VILNCHAGQLHVWGTRGSMYYLLKDSPFLVLIDCRWVMEFVFTILYSEYETKGNCSIGRGKNCSRNEKDYDVKATETNLDPAK